MKRIFSFALLFLFLYNMAGYYPVFLIMREKVRDSMEEKVRSKVAEEDLTVLTFTSSAYSKIEWSRDGNEFTYNGNMFDVVKQRKNKDGTIAISVINDIKEKALCSNLNDLTKKNAGSPAAEDHGVQLFKIFSGKYISQSEPLIFISPGTAVVFIEPSFALASFLKDIPSPPPKA